MISIHLISIFVKMLLLNILKQLLLIVEIVVIKKIKEIKEVRKEMICNGMLLYI
jgi:hypothetical protein